MASNPPPHQMNLSLLTSSIVFFLALPTLASEEPNTDGFYVSDFFQKMGHTLTASLGTSSTICSLQGVSCDAQMINVVGLAVSGLGLTGPIPENTIGKLGKLQFLDLSHNSITALSSDFWGLGSSLLSLNLSSNLIKGSLPNNIGNFGRMESLDLSGNAFSGEIPVGVSSLPSIKTLDLSRNLFEGPIPVNILSCKTLVLINFSLNQLNGTVPDGFSAAFKNLSSLDLAGNQIRGRLPDFSEHESISYLNLSRNLFQGSIIGVLRESLRVIDLSNNQFQGHISQVILNPSFNWSSLVHLDLSGNRLSGEFFSDWSKALSLKYLNLAFNRFSYQPFPPIQRLSGLEYLNLSHTKITGRIPELSTEKLQVLDLSVNNLTGEIPESLQERLSSMEHFNFSYNNLTLCASNITPETFLTAFIGSQSNCPIAANPVIIKTGTKHKDLRLALAIALSAFFLAVGISILALGCRKKSRSWAVKQLSYKEEPNISGPFSFQTDSTTWVADVKLATSVPVVIFEKPLLNFTFADLLSATSHFDRGTLLAEGRCGPVYRGFLQGGIHVAVKVLVNGASVTDREAARELERLGRIKHPNLVPLTGYCLAGDQRIAIYDYMENGNLQNLLHDLPLGLQATEDWSNDMWDEDNDGVQSITSDGLTTWRFRHRIALGTARALAFLHHGCFPQIVHRDVKASSVYLDSAFEPRLSDFGLEKIVGGSLENELSRMSPGYAPPEFSESESGTATPKSDVFGFGVVLFELITGKKPVGDGYPEEKETTLVGWARALVRKKQASRAIDPKIRATGSEKQMEEALRIAYLCTADLPSKRPSMQQIVGLLKDIEPVSDQ